MNSANIYRSCIIKQDAMVGYAIKKGFSLSNLIQNLIREYGTYRNNSFAVDVSSFDLSDKRLLISHFESAEWYEYACQSIEKTEAIFSEHESHIQNMIDQECFEVYRDVMEEMRAYK